MERGRYRVNERENERHIEKEKVTEISSKI